MGTKPFGGGFLGRSGSYREVFALIIGKGMKVYSPPPDFVG